MDTSSIKLVGLLVFILMFFTPFSQAGERFSCPEKPRYIIFDEVDMDVSNLIINYGLSYTPVSAHSVVVSIYTDKHLYDERNYWVASFVFDNGKRKYYVYNRKENKVKAVSSDQFAKSLQSVNKCNAQPEIPLFKKVISNFNNK